MELLNSTLSPPINIVSNVLNTRNSSLIENISSMEPNNLTLSASGEMATAATASDENTSVAQTFVERNLELKLPVLSSSSSDSESEDPSSNAIAGTSSVVDGERVASPPPNCAICLGRCKNKCFTDSCMHQFCFKCLCEWSKVKPECPLCKQTFKSIIHNVKSIHQFEEYHVQPPTVQLSHPPFEMDFQEMRIFGVVHHGHNRNHVWNEAQGQFFYSNFAASPYSTASTGGSLSTASGTSSNRSIGSSANSNDVHNQYAYRELLDLYRQEYPGSVANSGTLSQLWRRYVYDRKLYAMPVADITGRFRESSARFYRDNPSQIHRLMPWINRDIVCLLRQTQHDVTTVLESINTALTLINILSPAFRRRLQPFLGTKTAHFIHELNNFARSPYDMIGYDRAVQYLPQTNNEEIVIEFTSSDESTDNEQIDVAGDGININSTSMSSRSRSRSTNVSSINAINLTIHNRLTSASGNAGGIRGVGINGASNGSGRNEVVDDISLVIDLRGESDNNETTSTAQVTTISSNFQNNPSAGTSEGDMINIETQPIVSENIELTSGSSDECEFVLERKPPHLRTPEMVSLDSASDSDVVFVDESKPLNRTSFSSSEEELNEASSDHKHHSRHHSKIAALVEAKKRNQSGNLVKSEQQDSHTEVYNLGASTSAALRLSLQKRHGKQQFSGGSSKRSRRDKYCLRNLESQTLAIRQAFKTRGKRLNSESSHSSTSSSTSSSNSSASSSDEDYVASTSQRRKVTFTPIPSRACEIGRKTKRNKTQKANKGRTTKRGFRNRNNDNCTDDDDENDHIGKNYSLVMAMNERRKMKEQNQYTKTAEAQNESDDENSWRLNAVDEPLRKQQQRRSANSYKSNEHKRKHIMNTEQQLRIESKIGGKKQRLGSQTEKEKLRQKPTKFLNSEDTSSDESDNINLIQLKTKLSAQECQKDLRNEQTSINQIITNLETAAETAINNAHVNENDINSSIASSSSSTINNSALTTISVITTECETIPTAVSANIEQDANSYPTNCASDNVITPTIHPANGITNNTVRSEPTQNNLFHFTDDSNDNIQNDREQNPIDNSNQDSISNYQQDRPQLPSSSSLSRYQNNNNTHSHHSDENANHVNAAGDELCDEIEDDGTYNNVPTTINLNASNVYADGTSMSTTTTDTILHEAAEQISSAAVNFYNLQQIFNTADFADDNSTNSSSSDSSTSSSTTSVSSTSNSSSSNSNSYTNCGRS